MFNFDIKLLITLLVGIDIIFFVGFIVLIRRFSLLRRNFRFEKEIKIFESMVRDAEHLSNQFNAQLNEKHRLIKSLNQKLDRRIDRLNKTMNRSDILIETRQDRFEPAPESQQTPESKRNRILSLARKGCDAQEISRRLSISKGEVMLVLNLTSPSGRITKRGDVD